MKNGEAVAAFEREFAAYVNAKYAIAVCNGTATLHTALVAIGAAGRTVAVPPLTMSSTTLAVLHAGATPIFWDVNPATWLMEGKRAPGATCWVPVSLFGLHTNLANHSFMVVDDAAQTLRPHSGHAFTSYSFQASKILALGEGGMLVTDSEELATTARSFASLGYDMRADQPRIDPAILKAPTYARHVRMGWNYRLNDLTAAEGLHQLERADILVADRRACAEMYREAHAGCDWLTPQYVPEGWTHDYWTYAVAIGERVGIRSCAEESCRGACLFEYVADTIVKHGGERPYAAWRLTYQEPAFRHLAPDGTCPVAESLQPRLMQFQTNHLRSAERNAKALRLAIREIGG